MRVALIELGTSHEECLYAQASALRSSEHTVLLIARQSVVDRLSDRSVYDEFYILPLNEASSSWVAMWKLNRFLRKQQLDRIVFNSLSGSLLKKLCLLPNYPSVISGGILHDTKRLASSTGQKLIGRRMSYYLILADYLQAQTVSSKPVHTFYSFESSPADLLDEKQLQEDQTVLHLCVPGQLSCDRRDYLGLLEALALVPPSIKFKVSLLGRADHTHGDGPLIRSRITDLGLEKKIELWSDFVDSASFRDVLAKADYILPLIHPEHISGDLYEHQITGAFNLAYARQKTMLMHGDWRRDAEFEDTAIFYDSSQNLAEVIERLSQKKQQATYHLARWNPLVQRTAYLHALRLL